MTNPDVRDPPKHFDTRRFSAKSRKPRTTSPIELHRRRKDARSLEYLKRFTSPARSLNLCKSLSQRYPFGTSTSSTRHRYFVLGLVAVLDPLPWRFGNWSLALADTPSGSRRPPRSRSVLVVNRTTVASMFPSARFVSSTLPIRLRPRRRHDGATAFAGHTNRPDQFLVALFQRGKSSNRSSFDLTLRAVMQPRVTANTNVAASSLSLNFFGRAAATVAERHARSCSVDRRERHFAIECSQSSVISSLRMMCVNSAKLKVPGPGRFPNQTSMPQAT